MVKAIERRETSIGESVLYRLEVLYQRGEKILAEAESSGDGRLALASIRELREIQRDSFILATKAAEVGTDGPPQMEIHVIHIGGSPSTEA